MNLPTTDAAAVPGDAYLLDVREPAEWVAGHIPQSVHIPLGELAVRAGEVPRDREVYVVCRVGVRSAHAAAALNDAGWRAVNVEGGVEAWAHAGRPLVSETGADPYVA